MNQINQSFKDKALRFHKEWGGKIEISTRSSLKSRDDLSIAYTPGVAFPCIEIEKNPELSFDYTRRWNMCAVITDGSSVLGLGDIGPEAGMPVMEGKCALFKEFGDVDAFPICIASKEVEDIVKTVKLIQGSFGGINLEDISAPRCFEIERRLKLECNIPVFHDDQHGTAIVILAGLINAIKLTGKKAETVKIVINGAGAAATAISKLLIACGFENMKVCDRKGIISLERTDLNEEKIKLAELTGSKSGKGTLKDAVRGSDIFIGVSAPNTMDTEMVKSMAENPVVFACANPVPEIDPLDALNAGAVAVATGRSDYPNQINNVLAFPGVFRGVFDVRASDINEEMKIAAAYAIADLIKENELNSEYIIPSVFDKRVASSVAGAVGKAARRTGVARI